MKIDTVHNKSCQRMDELPNDFVDCALTSPPYWGLRDYGDNVKEIWGDNTNCRHEFGSLLRGHHPGQAGQVPQTKKQLASGSKDSGQFCQKCNAWQGQLGLEPTFHLYLDHLVAVCAEVKRVLKGTGSFWLNMGDTYYSDYTVRKAGKDAFLRKGDANYDEYLRSSVKDGLSKTHRRNFSQRELPSKCLIGIPWRLALRLVDEQGWILRNAVIWAKPNAMPSSGKDRCSNGYEFLFHLVKQKKYYYDLDAIREPHTSLGNPAGNKQKDRESKLMTRNPAGDCFNPSGKNPGDVWTIPTQPRPEAHFATFPDKLCEKPIKATCPQEICRKCGKARVRITKIKEFIDHPLREDRKVKAVQFDGKGYSPGGTLGKIAIKDDLGFTDCGCNAGFESGIVFDPFAGRGTTLIMAKKLGRHYVGYELKKEYCRDLIEPALGEIDPLFSKLV